MILEGTISKENLVWIFNRLSRLTGNGVCHIKILDGHMCATIVDSSFEQNFSVSVCSVVSHFVNVNLPNCEFVIHEVKKICKGIKAISWNMKILLVKFYSKNDMVKEIKIKTVSSPNARRNMSEYKIITLSWSLSELLECKGKEILDYPELIETITIDSQIMRPKRKAFPIQR